MSLLTVRELIPVFSPRSRESNKGTYGTVALVGGSECYSGAIRLANMALCATRSGAGITRLCAPRALKEIILPRLLESTYFPLHGDENGNLIFDEGDFDALCAGTRAVAFGMGCGNTPETAKAVRYLLTRYPGTLILDADGLNALAAMGTGLLRDAGGRVILTPHPGEFSRLSGHSIPEILEKQEELAVSWASEHKVILLLKGSRTVVTDGEKSYTIDRGCAGMATAGSGDVLSGILAAIAGWYQQDPLMATAAAAFVNGAAGEKAEQKNGDISMIAGDTAAMIPQVIREIRNSTR